MSHLTAEQKFLLDLSCSVWRNRCAAKEAGLPFNEETITETILLDLRFCYPGEVKLIAFNKIEEAKSGADWLWAFVSADGSQSFTMLVQAKRLNCAENVYSGINRNVGKANPPVRQIDRLLKTAAALGVPALYIFYNHVTKTDRIPQDCESLPSGNLGHIEGFGISLANALSVNTKLPDGKFDTHCSHSIPLHCLLCNKASGVRPVGGTPEQAARSVDRLGANTVQKDTSTSLFGLRKGLHPIVERALNMSSRGADDVGFSMDESMSGIAGVVFLRDLDGEKGTAVKETHPP